MSSNKKLVSVSIVSLALLVVGGCYFGGVFSSEEKEDQKNKVEVIKFDDQNIDKLVIDEAYQEIVKINGNVDGNVFKKMLFALHDVCSLKEEDLSKVVVGKQAASNVEKSNEILDRVTENDNTVNETVVVTNNETEKSNAETSTVKVNNAESANNETPADTEVTAPITEAANLNAEVAAPINEAANPNAEVAATNTESAAQVTEAANADVAISNDETSKAQAYIEKATASAANSETPAKVDDHKVELSEAKKIEENASTALIDAEKAASGKPSDVTNVPASNDNAVKPTEATTDNTVEGTIDNAVKPTESNIDNEVKSTEDNEVKSTEVNEVKSTEDNEVKSTEDNSVKITETPIDNGIEATENLPVDNGIEATEINNGNAVNPTEVTNNNKADRALVDNSSVSTDEGFDEVDNSSNIISEDKTDSILLEKSKATEIKNMLYKLVNEFFGKGQNLGDFINKDSKIFNSFPNEKNEVALSEEAVFIIKNNESLINKNFEENKSKRHEDLNTILTEKTLLLAGNADVKLSPIEVIFGIVMSA